MSNNKDFKVKNGIQPTSYFEGVGTVVSGSVGYNLAGASYDSVSFSVASQDTQPLGVAFKPDGTVMYVSGFNTTTVYQYSLSTAWDVSTASYASKSFDIGAQDLTPRNSTFKSDGTKMYMTGLREDSMHQYSLSTAWDVSTASYDSVSLSLLSQGTSIAMHTWSTDGTKIYITDSGNDSVYQYDVTTAWDLSTASYSGSSLSVNAQDSTPFGVCLNDTGTKLFIMGVSSDTVYQYSLSTAYDLSTASYDSVSFSVASQETTPYSVIFGNNGTKMYVVGATGDAVYQYSTVLTTATLDLSTGSVFEVTPTSDIQVTLSNPADSGTVSGATLLLDGFASTYDIASAVYEDKSFSVASQDTTVTSMAISNDGTKVYLHSNSKLYQYSLSTAFDISTASYDSVSIFLSAQDSFSSGITFKPDGTKMYMVGSGTDTVYQYSLSTPLDLSTVSYDNVSFSVASQDTAPTCVVFNNDGTKMYIGGITNKSVYQYTLSTPFDLSTASYDSVSFSVESQTSISFSDVAISNDGTKMLVFSSFTDAIFQYSLSTAFDISTASYSAITFSPDSQDTDVNSMVFSSDGFKMYAAGNGTDTIYQYSTTTPATITYDTAIEWPSGTAPTSPAIGETDVITFNTRDGGITYSGVLAIDGAQ